MPKPSAKKAVFISHISDETDLAQWLKARLDRDFLGGLEIFVSSDRSTIEAGRRWLDEVHDALKAADLQIVLCSSASVGRPWVNFEAGAVWLRGIPVVPACHSGLEPQALPIPLNMLQAVVLSRPEGLAKLYDAVAAAMGLRAPSVDFAAMASEAGVIEAKSARRAQNVEVIRSPRVLCAASTEYARPDYAFDLDVTLTERYFPGRVVVERALTPSRLRDLLTGERFDIVHLVLPVAEKTGGLVFNPVNENGHPTGEPAEVMSPAAFATLLIESQTRLVVLATCKALPLAVKVGTVANMAASEEEITGQDATAWGECFYRLLAQGKSVHKAFEITDQQITVPILSVRHKDVIFSTGTTS